jgi:ATP-dependent helicase/nuclease subunit A
MTIHAAKGLEWPTVLVPFCGGRFDRQSKDFILSAPGGGAALLGPWPNDAATTALEWQMRERGREEEHRLLYVALTRARDALHLISLRKKREVSGPPRTQSSFVNVLRAMYEFDYPEAAAIRVGPLAVRLVSSAS